MRGVFTPYHNPQHTLRNRDSPRVHNHSINNLKISKMVEVKDFSVRTTKDGRQFVALILQGGLSLVQSRQTGNYYATVKQVSIPSTFDEATARSMIGERVYPAVTRKGKMTTPDSKIRIQL